MTFHLVIAQSGTQWRIIFVLPTRLLLMTLDSFQIVLVDLATHVLFVAARQNLTLLGTEYVSVTLVVMDVAVCAAGADKSCIS